MNRIFITALLILLAVGAVLAQDMKGIFHQDVKWSPDGKRLSFSEMTVSMKDGKRKMLSDVFIVNSDGTGRVKITGPDRNEFFSSWSNDSKKIVYQASEIQTRNASIVVANIDGSDARSLTKGEGRYSAPIQPE